MKSRTQARYGRLLSRVAAVSTLLAIGLLSMEFLFPTVPGAPFSSSPDGEFQRLLLVVAVIFALASFAGAVFTTLLAWLAKWREREKDEPFARDARFGLSPEPANERLRALRAVTLEEISVREPGHSS